LATEVNPQPLQRGSGNKTEMKKRRKNLREALAEQDGAGKKMGNFTP
jgi:hypothetical protein